MIIRGRGTKQDLTRRLSMKTRRRLEIDKIDKSQDSFTPKISRHKGRNKKGTNCLINMTMLVPQLHSEHEHQDKIAEEEYPQKRKTHKKL
jgi:hypothetical protein